MTTLIQWLRGAVDFRTGKYIPEPNPHAIPLPWGGKVDPLFTNPYVIAHMEYIRKTQEAFEEAQHCAADPRYPLFCQLDDVPPAATDTFGTPSPESTGFVGQAERSAPMGGVS